MGYYMGDYYAGDYYRMARGDPGFFGFLGRAIKGVAGGVLGKVFPGGLPQLGERGVVKRLPQVLGKVGPIVRKVGPIAGVAAGGAAIGALGSRALAGAGGCPKGFHPCKSRYGCKRGDCVRNRRMNVCNPRALRRGIRRAAGFSKLARRVMRFTSPRPPRGRAYFRPKRRKRV
jgi:hypothetical protein